MKNNDNRDKSSMDPQQSRKPTDYEALAAGGHGSSTAYGIRRHADRSFYSTAVNLFGVLASTKLPLRGNAAQDA